MLKRTSALLALALAALLPASPAHAQAPKEVVIGVLYPLSGNAAQVGIDSVNAVRLAVDIINANHDLNLPLGKGEGLPGLGGAKIRVIFVDHQGKPDVGQAEAERLITQEKVHAVFGAYFSGVTQTVAQVAERYGVPSPQRRVVVPRCSPSAGSSGSSGPRRTTGTSARRCSTSSGTSRSAAT